MSITCNNCGKPINRGKWCSDKCRKAYSRAFEGKEVPDYVPKEVKPEPVSGWENSAETKTQEEIESHYTLENFPCNNRYYSANGGGVGALSPYRKTDPRHESYTT